MSSSSTATASSRASSSSVSVSNGATYEDNSATRSSSGHSDSGSGLNIEDMLKRLPEDRKKIVKLMTDYLKVDPGCDMENATYMAFVIEVIVYW